MTVGTFYIGGMGPYLYDDEIGLLDPDGNFPGETQSGMMTDGPIKTTRTPVDDEDMLRWVDVGVIVGDVIGPASAVDSNLPAFDTTTGKLFKDSGIPLEWFDDIQSAGIISGCVLSQTRAAGELDMSAGRGFIKTIDSEIGTTIRFNIDAETNLILTQDLVNYIYIDYNAGTPALKTTTIRSDIEWNRMYTLGRAFYNGVTLHILNSGVHVSNLARTEHERLLEIHGFEKYSGSVVSEIGTLNVSVTAGKFYHGHNKIETDAIDTTPITGLDTFNYLHYGTASWITDDAAAVAIDCTHYNDGDDILGSLTSHKYGVQWVYLDFDGHMHIIYDTVNGTLATANLTEPPASLPPLLSGMGKLLAKIVVQQTGIIHSIQNYNGLTLSSSGVPNHNDTGGLNEGDYKHLTAAEYSAASLSEILAWGTL